MNQHQVSTRRILAAALGIGVALPVAWADHDEDEETIPFDVASVFLELNNTDGDLGIHSLFDGEPWKMLELEDPHEREILKIWLRGRLRRQGLTELFYESAEPTFDELAPEQFLRRFPEGLYEVSGMTLEGEELESTSLLTHLLPAPPEISVSGEALPEDCDEGPVPAISEPFMVSWPAVGMSHPTLGRTGEPIEVDGYQLVLEREEPTLLKFTVDLPPSVTALTIPAGLTSPGEEIKVEVLVREASGNQTATESCFEVD